VFSVEDLGKVVECPKCHRQGKLVLDVSRARGHRYYYLAVRHSRDERHVIRRLTEDEVLRVTKRRAPAVEVGVDVEALRAKLEQLERENAQLRAQLEQLRSVEQWLMYARENSRVVGREESEALRLYYVKRKGYSEEQAFVAKSILEPLIERGAHGEVSTIVWGSLPSPI